MSWLEPRGSWEGGRAGRREGELLLSWRSLSGIKQSFRETERKELLRNGIPSPALHAPWCQTPQMCGLTHRRKLFYNRTHIGVEQSRLDK